MSAEDERYAALMERRYEAKRAGIVDRLRELADQFERETELRPNAVSAPHYSYRASSGVHAVMWGLANLNLDGFVLVAAEADVAPIVLAEPAGEGQ